MDHVPVAELESHFTRRFQDQDLRLDKVIHMVDALAEKVLTQVASGGGHGSDARHVRKLAEVVSLHEDRMEAMEANVRDKMDQIEGNVVGLAREFESGQLALPAPPGGMQEGNLREVVAVALESLEARVERSLVEVGS